MVTFLTVIFTYFLGVAAGHFQLARYIKKLRAEQDAEYARTGTSRRIGTRYNVLRPKESARYIRWIWGWPVYAPFILPVRFTWRAVCRMFVWLGFGDIYSDFAEEMGKY